MHDTSAESARSRPIDRQRQLAAFACRRFDVLVIGGGITGCAVGLDAASRGLRAALVERDDFASGTSSRSSKREHGLRAGMGVLATVKRALDPNGILNPGELGVRDAFGDATWPHATGRHAT